MSVFTNDDDERVLPRSSGREMAIKNWDGPKQHEDKYAKSLMMLPTDIALISDKNFKKHVERFAKDSEVFFSEFSDAICKLFELGVPFTDQERMVSKPSE